MEQQHDYKRTPDSIYKAIAGLRWPRYEITGTGTLAVVLTCSQKVIRCALPIEAQQIAAQHCGATCNLGDCFHTWHTVEELDSSAPKPFDTARSRANLERHK